MIRLGFRERQRLADIAGYALPQPVVPSFLMSGLTGFGSFASAARFCTAFDEIRQHFRFRSLMKQTLSLAQQRAIFRQRCIDLFALRHAA